MLDDTGARWRIRPVCWVIDEVLPEPPLITILCSTSEISNAVRWSCQQLRRENVIRRGNGIASAKLLLLYFQNICLHPDDPKYRRLRIGNRTFQRSVYDTGARGVLLALGFEELYGFMECGANTVLGSERVQQIADAMVIVKDTLQMMEGGMDAALVQPEGGDGYGRAGFGHAGGMDL